MKAASSGYYRFLSYAKFGVAVVKMLKTSSAVWRFAAVRSTFAIIFPFGVGNESIV